MRKKPIQTAKIGLLLSLVMATALMAIGPSYVKALTWNSPVTVPMDSQTLTVSPSVAEDQSGRVWLVWSEKPLGGSKHQEIYFKYRNPFSGSWVGKFNVSGSPAVDDEPFITPLSNGTMMILWSSNRTGNPEIFYRTYLSVSPVIPPAQLTSNPLDDRAVSAVQDRNGRIWVVWERANATTIPVATDIYYKYYDGISWSAEFIFPRANSPVYSERAPSILQTKDGRIWIVWASDEGGGRSLELYYATTDGTISTLPVTGIPASSWTPRVALTSDTKEDDNPVLIQARDGTLWLFWQRDSSTDGDILSMNSLDNGASWGRISPFPGASTTDTESLPSAAMMSDKLIWVFWNVQNTVNNSKDIDYSTSSAITGVHDVGIAGLSGTPIFLRSGSTINVSVTAANYGDSPENATLTVRLNNTVITTMSLTGSQKLLDGEKRLIQFGWTSQQGFWGRYYLNATITSTSTETVANIGDNSWRDGLERITPPGDVDFNGVVDILDAAALAFAYGSTGCPTPTPLWNPNADIDHNCTIDILDAAQLAFYFGKSV